LKKNFNCPTLVGRRSFFFKNHRVYLGLLASLLTLRAKHALYALERNIITKNKLHYVFFEACFFYKELILLYFQGL